MDINKSVLLLSFLFLGGCDQWKKFSTGTGAPAMESNGPVSVAVFGQSNAVSSSAGHPVISPVSGHVHVTDYYCDQSGSPCLEGMTVVTPDAAHPVKSNQAWMLLGDMLYGALGTDIAFYNTAHDSYSTQNLIDNGELDRTIATLRQHPEIKTLIYIQGESERPLTTEQSYQNLKYMIARTRAVNPSLQWVLNLNWFERAAQQRIIDEHLALQGVDMDALRAQVGAGTDFVGTAQMQGMAQAWFAILIHLKPWLD